MSSVTIRQGGWPIGSGEKAGRSTPLKYAPDKDDSSWIDREFGDGTLIGRHVIGPHGAPGHVGCRVDAGEGAEFVGEVRLVVVAAIESHLGPWHICTGMQELHRPLKAEDSRPGLGREANLFAKNLREAPLAPARGFCNVMDRGGAGCTLKPIQCKVDNAVPRELCGETLPQKTLQALQPFMERCQLTQPVAEQPRCPAPYVFQADAAIAEQVDGIASKGSKSAGMKDYPDQVGHVRGVDHLVPGPSTHDQSRRSGLSRLGVGAVEQKVARQVEDDLDAPGGQNALAAVGCRIDAGVPERADAAVERCGRDVLDVDHMALELVIARFGWLEKAGLGRHASGCDKLGGMRLPTRDAELVQIVDAALAEAARRAGDWLVCRLGCTQCCFGAFAINALDAARLRAGMVRLRAIDPTQAAKIEGRARAWIEAHGTEFPGDAATGRLGESEGELERFEDFANDAPCPALDEATGRCDVYAWRPMTCRVFGPPVRMDAGLAETDEDQSALGHCELCFHGANEDEVAACEMPVPHELEAELLGQIEDTGQTVVAYALLK